MADKQKTEANKQFQRIAFAYAILSDPGRRKRFDATGSTDEAIIDSEGFNWSDFYREQFQDAISTDAIERFAKQYKGSEEEKDDVLIAYERHKGNMNQLYETVMLSSPADDEERFREIILEAIKNNDVESFKAFTHEPKKSRAARFKLQQDESKEAEEHAKELGIHDKLFGSKKQNGKSGGNSEDALAAMILKRQADRQGSSFLDRLEEKYAGGSGSGRNGKGKKRAVQDDEPSEEAFQAAAAKLKGRNSAGKESRGSSRSKKPRK